MPYFIYIPHNFSLEVLPPAMRIHADSARYFLHRIIWGRVTKQRTLEEFVPLKFDYLRAVIPDRVIKPLKGALIDAGVIECDDFFVEHCKSLGYRLRPPYSDSPVVRVELTDRAVRRRVRVIRKAESRKVWLDVHKFLRQQLRKLDIDQRKALSIIADHEHYEIIKIPIQQMASRDFSFSVCRYGRVHTDLTRCIKKVRATLSVAGESLVEIDIKNSQPLFFALLLVNYRKQGNKTFGFMTFAEGRVDPYRDIDHIIHQTVTSFGEGELVTATGQALASNTTRILIRNGPKTPANTAVTTKAKSPQESPIINGFLRPDEQQFVSPCECGILYEALMQCADVPVRQWAKESLFEVLYGKNSTRSDFKTAFQDSFPCVSEVVRAHKRKDHAFLPQLMQNIESYFIVNTVCRRLMNELPDAPVFTIHDSILTTAGFAADVQTVMEEEFSRLGLAPSLRVTDYGKQ